MYKNISGKYSIIMPGQIGERGVRPKNIPLTRTLFYMYFIDK